MRSCYKYFFLLLFSLAIPLTSWAKSQKELRDAAAFFHDHQYQEALNIWNGLEKHNANGNLYFNIGLAESNLQHIPEAIYAFEQALRFQPGNGDFKNALELERKKIEDAVIPVAPFFLMEWYRDLICLWRPGFWAFLGLVLLVVTIFSYLSNNKLIHSKWEIKSRWTGLCFIAGVLFLFAALLSYAHLTTEDEAIVMQSCDLRQASSIESPLLRQLNAGEKVIIKDKIGDWYYVSLLNLDYGWMDQQCLNIIRVEL